MNEPENALRVSRVEPGEENLADLDPRVLTPARIGLERAGISLATKHVLELAEAHALARDAVHAHLPVAEMLAALVKRGLPALALRSAAGSRAEYLRRPDFGRRLAPNSEDLLQSYAARTEGLVENGTRFAVTIGDGLSAMAVERHALPLLDALLPKLGITTEYKGQLGGWSIAAVVVAEQARVALGDRVAEVLSAELGIVLIGERPGLSSPDSLGAYITWRPRVGSMDAERNCVSNIRADGLGYGEAAARIAWYCIEGRRTGTTGVALLAGPTGPALGGSTSKG
ncbi:MAG: ethanolamine ammonia-lyase subunit EutC [Acidobacteriaceae bacterium]